jgi:hypothetical protein
MGIHAYATGEGRIRREPQREGREDVSTVLVGLGNRRARQVRPDKREMVNLGARGAKDRNVRARFEVGTKTATVQRVLF